MASVNKAILVGNLGRIPKSATHRTEPPSAISPSPPLPSGRTRPAVSAARKPSGTASSCTTAWPKSRANT